MTRWSICALILLAASCGPKPAAEEPGPAPKPKGDPVEPEKPYIEVPPVGSYSWLKNAGIVIARPEEKASIEAKLGDFYSGLPNFMVVLAMATKDRSVGLRDNPAYLSDIWKEYLAIVKRTEEDPPTALDDFDLGMCYYAIYRAWKIENPHSGVDNYDDAVTTVTYPE